MLLTNHVLTGIALGLAIDNPAVLAPTAVASHLALDVVPHFGWPPAKDQFQVPFFIVCGTLDVAASAVVTAAAIATWPHRLVPILIGTIGAALPDLTYTPITAFGEQRIFRIPGYRVMIRFLSRIQWYERPLGLITEATWAMLMLGTLQHLL